MHGLDLRTILLGAGYVRESAQHISDGVARVAYRRERDRASVYFDADKQSGLVYVLGVKAAESPLTLYRRSPDKVEAPHIDEWLTGLREDAAKARETRAHLFIESVNCNCTGGPGCMICDGGLGLCSLCGLLEGSLTTECPGTKCYDTHSERVYAGEIDFVRGEWTEGAISIHSPASVRRERASA